MQITRVFTGDDGESHFAELYLELIDQGWDHYQVMKIRTERQNQMPPKPKY